MAVYYKQVRLPSDVLEALGDHSGHWWSAPELEPVIVEAIRAFIKPASATRQRPADMDAGGYQWKQLFLPEGTRLRASFGGIPSFAVVEGDDIVCDGRTVSPSGFANQQGCGNRNAWKAVWLRFPGSEQWLLADVRRARQNAAISRLFNGDAPTADRATAPHPVPASRAKRAAKPQFKPKKQAVRPPDMAARVQNEGKQREHGAGRSARRKRRAQKRVPGNP
ncbi:hypothetical protein H3H37_11110 [Duganella sp. LX20W]|uniref:Uncharacterized protein n=1 Tax=Rugamonas brunnea TaxID=2758569 RepID=A0A7W2IC52_9BURK|nr:hypothetical protein [Rugamonas brunnea]MBA5637602.1 hypothetical protein [Rugamonas brunnea]